MIRQVLNRTFVLERMEAALGCLKNPPEELPPFAQELSAKRFERAASELGDAAVAERTGSSASTPDPAGTRGTGVRKLDELAFISRDPRVNLVQSALEEYFVTVEQDRVQTFAAAAGQRAEPIAVPVTDLEISLIPNPNKRFGKAFEIPTDPKWICCKLAEWLTATDRHPFNPNPPPPIRIADDARVVLVGDWGTGLPRARSVAAQIRRSLDEHDAAGRERHVIHLGDVYYSGWPFEVERRFLAHWPVEPAEADAIGSFALNGNHEMYSGGHGYFRTLLGDPRFVRQRGASFFKLVNDHWQVLGLDTSYEDHQLAEPQPNWLADELAADERAAVLLSHHQLFGADGQAVRSLNRQVRGPLSTGRVRAWFWGHEHSCVLYEPHLNIPFARCIGYGGVPVYMWRRKSAPYRPPVAYEYREFIRSGMEQWALLGFALLDFAGPEINIRYVDERGYTHNTETISR